MTCAECEHLHREDAAAKGKAMWRCTHPGEKQGRVVAVLPDWCGKSHCWDRPAWCPIEKEKKEGEEE